MKTRTVDDLDGGTFEVPDKPAIPAIELESRQSAIMREMTSLWFRAYKGEATKAEAKILRELEAEFAANNERLQRRKRKVRQ
mgnify:FL=1